MQCDTCNLRGIVGLSKVTKLGWVRAGYGVLVM